MPVTARRTSLSRAVNAESSTDRPTGRTIARHRKSSKSSRSGAPRAAAAVLSVGLAVGGGAALSLSTTPATASAATMTAAQQRGHTSIPSRPLLRLGDSGPTVKYVQKALHLGPDGYFGTSTVRVLKKFQTSWGLKATGYTDKKTWGRLTWAAKHKVLYGNHGASSASAGVGTFRAKVLKEAAKLKGTPYRYGGTSTSGFDCSGYTGYVYKYAGHKLPRTAREQYAATKHISRSAAKPGDLVFFSNGGGGVYHVGIYAGGNMLWHSSRPGRPVAKAQIWTSSVAFGRI
ncbi:cell wall-associated NlpC family hydrolase [Kribbella aluminosa]|uniref:Cell wall-associated NlpC family hydrolase n=1 Tax=Kribbella aluminosa TaxID=416017 RepID=A0ABS4US67_9ACTN|nr:NlpC/P60 family protein [Kribbella aluminosa]MBP2354482.1 cell wall-associated NlpC family hydrolase [Kribbella aluminosa]